MDHLTQVEDALTKKQEGFCETSGILGVFISATCLIQHLVFTVPHWITYTILLVYILSVIGFVLLAKKSALAFPLIVTSAVLVFLLEIFMILVLVFSLVLLLLLLYTILVLVLIKVYDIQKQLKQKQLMEKQEKEKWDNIYR